MIIILYENSMLPKDPFILFSVLNTKLRDQYSSLDVLCEDMQVNKSEITELMKSIGYEYDDKLNKFVS